QCKIILVGHVVIPLWCENRKDNLTYHLLLRSWNLQKQSYTTDRLVTISLIIWVFHNFGMRPSAIFFKEEFNKIITTRFQRRYSKKKSIPIGRPRLCPL